MKFVADTHSLVWYLQDNPKLSAQKKSQFETTVGSVIIPAIVIAELLYIAKKVRMDFTDTISHIENSPAFEIHPLSIDIIKIAASYNQLEMHDALITATAKRLSLPLMTIDRQIIKSGFVEIL